MSDATIAALAVIGAAVITGLVAIYTKRAEVREAARRDVASESVQARAQIAEEAERIRSELRGDLDHCREGLHAAEQERDRWHDEALALRRERDDALAALEQSFTLGRDTRRIMEDGQ